jgi:hypothetical protein
VFHAVAVAQLADLHRSPDALAVPEVVAACADLDVLEDAADAEGIDLAIELRVHLHGAVQIAVSASPAELERDAEELRVSRVIALR